MAYCFTTTTKKHHSAMFQTKTISVKSVKAYCPFTFITACGVSTKDYYMI